jgi:glycerophosphoryl diester phosphodiesterase
LSTIPLPSQQGRPLVIAHRGASAYKPENTMAAYQLAIDQQADMIEIDLHTTQDGAIAVSHDGGLEHLGAKGEIADVCWAELQQLDAGEGERVPCLDEVLDRFGESIPFEAINPHVLLVDADLVEAAHGEGMAVYVYTVDALDTMLRLIDLGVDGLFTNRPDRMRELLSSRGI